MMMPQRPYVLKLFFVVIFLSTVVYFFHLKPRVMVIHSGSEQSAWSQDFNKGLCRFFSQSHPVPSFFYTYLDTENHPSESYRLKTGVLVRQDIERLNPNILILCGPDAQEMIGRTYINFSNRSIIFAGIKGSAEDYGYEDANNVTGVFEHFSLKPIKDLISYLTLPHQQGADIKIMVLGDTSSFSKSLKRSFLKKKWAPYRLIEASLGITLEDWKNALLSCPENPDVVIVAGYQKMYTDYTQNQVIPPQEVLKWLHNNTTAFVVGTTHGFVKDGGALALSTSPLGQGEKAAVLSHRLLKGGHPKSTPPIDTPDFLVYVSKNNENQRLKNLPAVYKAFSNLLGP